MLSAEGGVEIEAVAESNPDAIVKLHIDPVDGLDLANDLDLVNDLLNEMQMLLLWLFIWN